MGNGRNRRAAAHGAAGKADFTDRRRARGQRWLGTRGVSEGVAAPG